MIDMNAQLEFKEVMKEIHSFMKGQKFRKKGRNFYKKLDGFGLVMNIQKSAYNSWDQMQFTINLGIFIPEDWSEKHKSSKDFPAFPYELDCAYRQRIGHLIANRDIWYKLDKDNNDGEIVIKDLQNHILPFFEKVSVKEDALDFIRKAG